MDRTGHEGRPNLSAADAGTAIQRRDQRVGRGWLLVHLVTLAVAAGILAYLNRNQWFFGDEWEFFANRGLVDPTYSIWRPHNVHWSTIPILVFDLLRAVVGLGSYWPYIGVLIAAHVALAHVLWRVALRAGTSAMLATAGVLVFALLGAGSENLLWAFQIGFVGALLLGWLAALLADVAAPLGRRDVPVIALLIGSLMCSGIGVPMVALVSLLTLVRSRSWLRAAVVGAVPAAVFLTWYFLIGDVNNQPTPESFSIFAVARHVAAGLAGATESITGIGRLLALLLLVLAGAWWLVLVVQTALGRHSAQRLAIALVGPAGAALFLAIVSLGRTGLDSSRYYYVVAALVLPAVLLAASTVARRPWVQAVGIVLIAVVGLHNLTVLRDVSVADGERERLVRETVIAAAHLASTEDDFLATQPEMTYDPDITVGVLRRLVARDDLPSGPVTPAGSNSALLGLRVAASLDPTVYPLAESPTLSAETGVREFDSRAGDECWVAADGEASPRVLVTTGPGLEAFRVESTSPATVLLTLGVGTTASQARAVNVLPGAPVRVVLDLPPAQPLTISLATPGASVCGFH